MQPMRAAEAQVLLCRKTHPTVANRVQVAFVVAPGGEVTRASADGPLEGTPMGNCAAEAVKAQTFPKSKAGVSKSWTLALR